MSGVGSEEETHITYSRVPWFSWEEWNFVRKTIFSTSPNSISSALTRVSTWRSRGCLPCAIEVTAALVEVRQRDPFFREGMPCNALESDEMLAMGYCMAIIRLVNSFAEKSRRKTGLSISESADALGIPSMLIDIRHECSHRELPSLALVRLASTKAIEWLKSYYWEPQKRLIPNVQKEIKSRLREMTSHLTLKHHGDAGCPPVKRRRIKQPEMVSGRKRFFAHMSDKLHSSKSEGSKRATARIIRSLRRLYSAHPLEVVSALLEEFVRTESSWLDNIDVMDGSDSSEVEMVPNESKFHDGKFDAWKTAVLKLSHKEPLLLVAMVEEVLKMIKVREATRSDMGQQSLPSSEYRSELFQIGNLSSLVRWLLHNASKQKFSDPVAAHNETHTNSIPKSNLWLLLRNCLLLAPGNSHLVDSVLRLVQMIGNDSLAAKFKKLPLLCSLDPISTLENCTASDFESNLRQHEDFLRQAEKKLEDIKHRKKHGVSSLCDSQERIWSVAKSWSSSAIGLLPYPLGSFSILPADYKVNVQEAGYSKDHLDKDHSLDKREESTEAEFVEKSDEVVQLTIDDRMVPEGIDDPPLMPTEGSLLIGGVFRRIGKEELVAIESGVWVCVTD
ncbi:hypothetical protein H6P81_011085 [Aristolochia fimbriata]|uniref:Uncharacterized protein n=1 Tax=Aristolochia fimbriata TaxID=158543 RepID=A0AAV7ESP4_ARIFI|nr:hypothetical protein H6P81_011085 [Aristolochia fimbriata]